jgi:hypothetical protein
MLDRFKVDFYRVKDSLVDNILGHKFSLDVDRFDLMSNFLLLEFVDFRFGCAQSHFSSPIGLVMLSPEGFSLAVEVGSNLGISSIASA